MGGNICLSFDESGNMGKDGKYFTIACIEMENNKPLCNVMKRSLLKVKKKFPKYQASREIKAKEANQVIKDFLIRKIVTKDIKIHYIVADLDHVKPELKQDENLLYNYMLQILIAPIARRRGLKKININLDKRTIKVKSENSFEDYIKLKLLYEYDINVNISVNYLESHNSLSIQSIDFIANAIQAKYEYEHDYFYSLFYEKIEGIHHFPRRYFGTSKIANF